MSDSAEITAGSRYSARQTNHRATAKTPPTLDRCSRVVAGEGGLDLIKIFLQDASLELTCSCSLLMLPHT